MIHQDLLFRCGLRGKLMAKAFQCMRTAWAAMRQIRFYWGHCPHDAQGLTVVLLPCSATTFYCGLAGLISIQQRPPMPQIDLRNLQSLIQTIQKQPLQASLDATHKLNSSYLSGQKNLERLLNSLRLLKREKAFTSLFQDIKKQEKLKVMTQSLTAFIKQECHDLQQYMGHLSATDGELADQHIEKLKDAAWCLKTELIENIAKVTGLIAEMQTAPDADTLKIFYSINTALNSIDRLEVRGRDSAGISLLFILNTKIFAEFKDTLTAAGLAKEFNERNQHYILGNTTLSINTQNGDMTTSITLTYKVAAEIGCLGDNVRFLRQQIATDAILHLLTQQPHLFYTVSAHTRWASVGAITVANCHPMDNATTDATYQCQGIIHACLNGDIDNYLLLKQQWEAEGRSIPDDITTDTKIIPLQIEKYLLQGHTVAEAFRLAVSDFEGSHAIAMHTDLAPGKFFLAQKGSGQAIFVGIAEDHYLPTSEVYGFVEQTPHYIKLDGEKIIKGTKGATQGQIVILDQAGTGGIHSIRSMYYDGTEITLTDQDILSTEITSRDIDRQNFPHYFLKEIFEAPLSVAKTLQNRWKIVPDNANQYTIALDEAAFPTSIANALSNSQIRRVYFIGQGTAGVAAQVCADILDYYLNAPNLNISALKASELSGFQIESQEDTQAMTDALVVAISQSGTTTDTNRTVDMVRSRGAHTLAIVNRRDSDITFKVNGVIYTSSGRDIEMSVASTKAFYSQIVAGALVGLKIAQVMGRRSDAFIADEIQSLIALPDQMRSVLNLQNRIKSSAEKIVPAKTYWAAVGSGPNKAAADEIRIKLSELCYKTISSDYIEDKKHIDLSAEPLIIVCAAGTNETVIGDIIKDTAIFKAHKATPVVIADEDDYRFEPYAEVVFHVPAVHPHLAPILNTLAGHLWGYYAALAINSGSLFLHEFRQDIQQTLNQFAHDGLDVYEVILEKTFREKIARFYTAFRRRQTNSQLPATITYTADLILLLKYLSGRLPVSDFELDFGKKGTALNMLNSLFEFLGESINDMSRPVDAIKHQAKTVTVGTSRISEKVDGILFNALMDHHLSTAQLSNHNILVLKNLQDIILDIKGSILYKIGGLNVLGEPTDHTTIEIIRKKGMLKPLTSRVETDHILKGTKRIIVRMGNVYIGKGRKDDRSIIIIPAFSTDPDAPNRIEHLLLLNIEFKEDVPLLVKIKALGGKYEHIKNIVQENSVSWKDELLSQVAMDELFGRSAEKISEYIVKQINPNPYGN